MAFDVLAQNFNDLKFQVSRTTNMSSDVVLLAIDDPSLREIGAWPWPRDLIAEMMDRLVGFGPKAVGMGITFSESSAANNAGDRKFSEVVERSRDKVVLGTYSSQVLDLEPYQDYCATEAFLRNGGDELVKLNTSFVVDDPDEAFDDLQWGELFPNIFTSVEMLVEEDYLSRIKKTDINSLTRFQKNFLQAEKGDAVFRYCAEWLTDRDRFRAEKYPELIMMYAQLFDTHKILSGLKLKEQIDKIKSASIGLSVPQYGYWYANAPTLQKPARFTASFISRIEVDGFLRRYPLFYRSGSRLGTSFIPSLALQTYLAGSGNRAEVKVTRRDRKKTVTSFLIKDSSSEKIIADIPVDEQGQIPINYQGPRGTLPYVSARDLFSDDPDVTIYTRVDSDGPETFRTRKEKKEDFFKGKYVIVGATASGLSDLHNTPVDVNFPGAEIHLSVLRSILDKDFLRPLGSQEITVPILVLATGTVSAIAFANLEALAVTLLFVAILAVGGIIDFWMFMSAGRMFSAFYIFLNLTTVYLVVNFYKYVFEERARKGIRQAFSKYVSPGVVAELLKSNDNTMLGGAKREVSIFFSDIRGFSEFSETMDPAELSKMLTEYLTPMTEIIFANKGTLDKYIGDGVMAFFGAPVDDSDHAYHACLCALQSLEKLKELNTEFVTRSWPVIDIGIGVNTGIANVGNMGSRVLQNYTAIGDSVNLAARLEGINKDYGTRVIVSEATYMKIRGRLLTREIDVVKVKGKKQLVRIYEVMSASFDQNLIEWITAFEDARRCYENQEFVHAFKKFEAILKGRPDDQVAALYMRRCAKLIANPPSDDWDGIYKVA